MGVVSTVTNNVSPWAIETMDPWDLHLLAQWSCSWAGYAAVDRIGMYETEYYPPAVARSRYMDNVHTAVVDELTIRLTRATRALDECAPRLSDGGLL